MSNHAQGRSIATHVVGVCRLPVEAQSAVVDRPDLVSAITHNEVVDLDPAIFRRIYAKKQMPSADDAVALLSRALTEDQMAHVLSIETRNRPIKAMCESNRLPTSIITLAFSKKKIASIVAERLVAHGFLEDEEFTTELRAHAAGLAGAEALLRWIDADQTRTDADVEAAFANTALDYPTRLKSSDRAFLARLVEAHPSVMHALVRSNVSTSVLQVLCSSRHLTEELQREILKVTSKHPDQVGIEYALLALVNHPVCVKDVVESVKASWPSDSKAHSAAERRLADWEKKPTVMVAFRDIDDEVILEWLVRRACSFSSPYNGYTPAKPFEVVELCYNQHLSQAQKDRLASDLYDPAVRNHVGDAAFRAAFEALHQKPFDPHNTEKWEVGSGYRPPHVKQFVRGVLEPGNPADGGQLIARTLAMPWRGMSHAFVDTLVLTTSQWGLFFELLDMMPDASIAEIAAVAETS